MPPKRSALAIQHGSETSGRARRVARRAAAALLVAAWLGGAGAAGGPCGAHAPARARHMERPKFTAEVTAFVAAEGTQALLHVEVPYTELAFHRSGDGLEAAFDLIVHVYRGDRQSAGDVWPERIHIADRAALADRAARYARDFPFALSPGFYEFEVQLSEARSGKEGRLCLGLDVAVRVPGRIQLSSLLVGECGLSGTIAELRRDPRISVEIDEQRSAICAYAELYHPDLAPDTIGVSWILVASGGQVVRQGRAALPAASETTPLVWEVPLGELWLDLYRLEVEVTAAGQQASGATGFALQTESDPALSAFFREDLGVLAYIADEEEVAELRMAAPEERRRRWDEFWAKRDPTPDDGRNEFKEDFFRRVQYANQEFTVLRRGWKTDRGRIYITYGTPDEVQRDPYFVSGRSVEVWFYDQLSRSFVFIDRKGYGDYELQGSE